MMSLRSGFGAVVCGGLLVRPVSALACPTCFGSLSSGVFETYVLSTIALSLLPFVIIGTIAAIAWHVKRQAESDAALSSEQLNP